MADEDCEKCHGTGIVKDETGVHTCWECLKEGKLDVHSKQVKDSGIKI